MRKFVYLIQYNEVFLFMSLIELSNRIKNGYNELLATHDEISSKNKWVKIMRYIPIFNLRTPKLEEKIFELRNKKMILENDIKLWEIELRNDAIDYAVKHLPHKKKRNMDGINPSNETSSSSEVVITPSNNIKKERSIKITNILIAPIDDEKSIVKSIVTLKKAVGDIYNEWKEKGGMRLEMCKDYLETHEIKNKPNYTAEKLLNRLMKYIDQVENNKPAPK